MMDHGPLFLELLSQLNLRVGGWWQEWCPGVSAVGRGSSLVWWSECRSSRDGYDSMSRDTSTVLNISVFTLFIMMSHSFTLDLLFMQRTDLKPPRLLSRKSFRQFYLIKLSVLGHFMYVNMESIELCSLACLMCHHIAFQSKPGPLN